MSEPLLENIHELGDMSERKSEPCLDPALIRRGRCPTQKGKSVRTAGAAGVNHSYRDAISPQDGSYGTTPFDV